MNFEDFKKLFRPLQRLMRGRNFCTIFGAIQFEECYNLSDFREQLKIAFIDTDPKNAKILSIERSIVLECIDEVFSYRGDSDSGFSLNSRRQNKLENLQRQYLEFIGQAISKDDECFSYVDELGIPGYPVFWSFCFIVIKPNGQSIFVYASASD